MLSKRKLFGGSERGTSYETLSNNKAMKTKTIVI